MDSPWIRPSSLRLAHWGLRTGPAEANLSVTASSTFHDPVLQSIEPEEQVCRKLALSFPENTTFLLPE
jgi:hypothetical protein